MNIYLIIGGVLLLVALWVISIYNSLVRYCNRVKANWSNVDVQLKRRADLIPNLVNTVKGYASHEKETLENVIKARNTYMSASTPEEQIKASGELSQVLSRLMVLTESYPDLKANTNFMELQNSLAQTEDKISIARQIYNDSVYSYDNKRGMFPSNIIAGLFNFPGFPFFEADEASREAPKVQF